MISQIIQSSQSHSGLSYGNWQWKDEKEEARELDPADKSNIAHISTLVTLQKEDVKMKKLMAQ